MVALRKTGSATLAPAHASIELIVEHICGVRAGYVPASVMLNGEYGIRDVVLECRAISAASGVISVEELPLPADEMAALKAAATAIAKRLGSE
ncbi:MAG: hypothetical protein R3D29_08330 [Nitratireductor sp.]